MGRGHLEHLFDRTPHLYQAGPDEIVWVCRASLPGAAHRMFLPLMAIVCALAAVVAAPASVLCVLPVLVPMVVTAWFVPRRISLHVEIRGDRIRVDGEPVDFVEVARTHVIIDDRRFDLVGELTESELSLLVPAAAEASAASALRAAIAFPERLHR